MVFNGKKLKEAVKFWCGVFEYENHMKEHSFEELSSYSLPFSNYPLTTPMSNAVFERIFPHVTNVKIKKRKRISVKMLKA